MDNLNGQLALMDSAWDALRTTIGEEFNPELRRLAETGTDVLSRSSSTDPAKSFMAPSTWTAEYWYSPKALAETGTDVLSWANSFVQAHPALVKGVMAFTRLCSC